MSQTNDILRDLKRGKRLTAIVALHKYGCMRLAARVRNLRDSGIDVKTNIIERNGKRFAEYYI